MVLVSSSVASSYIVREVVKAHSHMELVGQSVLPYNKSHTILYSFCNPHTCMLQCYISHCTILPL